MDPNRSEHHDDDFGAMDSSMISSTSPYQPTTERVPDRRPFVAGFILDMQYIKSLAGVLKIVEIVVDIIVAICLGTVGNCSSSCGAVQFLQFVCISAMIFTTVIFVIYAFTLQQKIEIINWPLTDLINCGIFSVLYVIGSSFLAAKAVTASGKAATAFGFICVILYVMSSWRAYTIFVIDRKKRQSPVSHIQGIEENTETQDLA